MFQPIQSLPLYDPQEKDRLQNRWGTPDGEKDQENIIKRIQEGAGEDFLEWDFQHKIFSVLEDDHDLKGIKIFSLDIDFPKADNFQALDFAYSEWWHSTFRGGEGSFGFALSFARLNNCEFRNCVFAYFYAYGTTFEKCRFIDCDFIAQSRFSNCEFIDCEFQNPLFIHKPFQDCLFDNNTHIKGDLETLKTRQFTSDWMKYLEKKQLPEIYKSIKDAYLAGEVFKMYRNYYFLQKQAERKNYSDGFEKIKVLIQEYLVGYGVQPFRTFWASVVIIILFALVHWFDQTSTTNPFITSMAAFVTMGSVPQSFPFNYLFVFEGFLGFGLFALFITTLANVWFFEK